MDEVINEVKRAVTIGRTDVLNNVLEHSQKYADDGITLREKILGDLVVEEGTFLHLSTKLGQQDVVRALLTAGANPLIENKQGENAYEMVATDSMQQVYVEELLRSAAKSDIARMDQLIKAGVDINSWDCDEKKNSVLHWAVSFGNAETVKYLIDKGADVNCETAEGVTPLHDAVDRGDTDIVQILLKSNASPLIKAEKGKFADESPLDLASQKPAIFSLLSHFLAAQFKRTHRSSSIDSLGPESPIYPKETNPMRSPPVNGHHTNVTPENVDYIPLHPGFSACLEGIIRGLESKAPIQPIITDTNLSLLWPQPKNLQQLEGLHFRPEKILHLSVIKSAESVHRILDVFSTHKDVFEKLGYDVTAQQVQSCTSNGITQPTCILSSHIQCCVNPDILSHPSSYRLHISSQKVRITASDLCGLNYSISTFLQLLTLYSKEEPVAIPPLIINDSPSLKHRAVFIDVSQERIPTIESLFEIIKLLGMLKINYLHLHMRLDKNGSPLSYTKGEIVAIDRNCQDACITLVPAIDVPCGISVAEYFQFIKPVIKEILPCFASSKYVHIGPQLTSLIFLRESVETNLGINFSAIWEFLPVSEVDSVVMMCFNALKAHVMNPSLLSAVPDNIVLVEYGFQADYNFGASMLEMNQSGISSCICVGTAAWSSLAGCPEASLSNCYHGTLNAVHNSSLGLIVANWSGSCNFTPLAFAWAGFLLASGLAWNHQTHWEYLQGSLASLISTYILKDKSGISGQVLLQLGCTETSLLRVACNQQPNDMANLPPANGSTLYRLLTDPDTVSLENISLESFIKSIRAIRKCQILLMESKINNDDNPVFDELCLTMELMLLACRIGRSLLVAGINPRSNMGLTVVNFGISNLPPTVRTDIANKLLILTDEYRRVWLLRNFPQGMETSLYTLTSVLQRFIPDSSRMITGRLMNLSPKNSISLTNGDSSFEHESP